MSAQSMFWIRFRFAIVLPVSLVVVFFQWVGGLADRAAHRMERWITGQPYLPWICSDCRPDWWTHEGERHTGVCLKGRRCIVVSDYDNRRCVCRGPNSPQLAAAIEKHDVKHREPK